MAEMSESEPIDIKIDWDLCMGSGNCMFWAPDTFDLSEDGHAVVTDPDGVARGEDPHRRGGLPRRRHLAVAQRHPALARGRHLMPIAVTEEHESLRRTAQRWLETHCPPTEPRALAEAVPTPSRHRTRPSCRPCGRRWPHRAGSGCTSRRRTAGRVSAWPRSPSCSRSSAPRSSPARVLPTLLVSAALVRHADRRHPPPAAARPGRRLAHRRGGARRRPSTPIGPATVRSSCAAPFAPSSACRRRRSCSCRSPDRPNGACSIAPSSATPSAPTRCPHSTRPDPSACSNSPAANCGCLPTAQVLVPDETVRSLALVLSAAESAGLARWCLDTASDYAKVRVQFGRPIGQFQAVKHALADMLVAVEQCAAVAWDAAAAWSDADADADATRRQPSPQRADRGRGRAPRRRALRQAVHPDTRWHRLHLGARRASVPEAGDGQPAAGERRRHRCDRARRGQRGRWPAPGATWPPTCPPRRSRCGQRSGRSSRTLRPPAWTTRRA